MFANLNSTLSLVILFTNFKAIFKISRVLHIRVVSSSSMFHQLVKYLWNPASDNAQDDGSLDSNAAPSGAEPECGIQTLDGVITSLANDHGMINHDIYFDRSLIESARALIIGERVSVTAERKHNKSGWVATRITSNPASSDTDIDNNQATWNDNNQPLPDDSQECDVIETSQRVAEVTHFRDTKGYLNKSISFNLQDCIDDYKPERGDWVSCTVESDGSSRSEIASDVKPLRQTTFEGRVASVQSDHGCITHDNDDIFFLRESCVIDYVARKGDRVCGEMIEFKGRRRQNWRATSIRPISAHLTNQRIE